MMYTSGHELGWNDTIQEDGGSPNVILPEGDYPFEVIDYEKTRSRDTGKYPSCPMAKVHLEFDGADLGTSTVFTNFLLHTDFEWKISQFFVSIGQKRKGERISMNWDAARHAHGRAHLTIRTWVGNDGSQHQSNEVKYFLDYDEDKMKSPKGFKELGSDESEGIPF